MAGVLSLKLKTPTLPSWLDSLAETKGSVCFYRRFRHRVKKKFKETTQRMMKEHRKGRHLTKTTILKLLCNALPSGASLHP